IGKALFGLSRAEFRQRDPGAGRWVVGVNRRSLLELFEREIGLAVGHVGIAQESHCRSVVRCSFHERFEVSDRAGWSALAERNDRGESYRIGVSRDASNVSGQEVLRLGHLPELELRGSL